MKTSLRITDPDNVVVGVVQDPRRNESFNMGNAETSPLTEEFLLEVETRLKAATPGPWESFVESREHTSGSSFIRTPARDIERCHWRRFDDTAMRDAK